MVQSISLSDSEADQVADATDVWFEMWDIDENNIERSNGMMTTTVTTKNTKGKVVNTGIKVYSTDGKMWYSEAYKKKADSLEE